MNDAGRMVEMWWKELNCKFPTVTTDVYIVMPNHFHGILFIHPPAPSTPVSPAGAVAVGADLCVCPIEAFPTQIDMHAGTHADAGTHAGVPLPMVMQWFKTMTTNEYIRGVKASGWVPFNGRLWQRSYYERIIRSERALQRIRAYILENPLRWSAEAENPDRAV